MNMTPLYGLHSRGEHLNVRNKEQLTMTVLLCNAHIGIGHGFHFCPSIIPQLVCRELGTVPTELDAMYLSVHEITTMIT